MITVIIEVVLGLVLVIIVMQFFKKFSTPRKAVGPSEDLANLKVTDARAGDVLSIAGAGDDMADLDFTSDRATWYQAGARRWFELSGPYKERRVSLRVESGEDGVETSLHSEARKLTLEDLGVSEDDLAQMDERQNTADNFEFGGKMWGYRLSREVESTRSDQPQPVGSYYWEFREEGGKGLLAIRKPAAEPFLITSFAGIHPGDVTVYRGHA